MLSTSTYDMEKRQIEVVFVREYKGFISSFSKKSKTDYILNVTKIVKDKFNTRFIIPNKVQSFLLNYEVKKLLDKAIKVKNKKYTRIIYLNANLSISTILNSIDFINDEYVDIEFNYIVVPSKELEEDDEIISHPKISVLVFKKED
jgi:hypothetical protein